MSEKDNLPKPFTVRDAFSPEFEPFPEQATTPQTPKANSVQPSWENLLNSIEQALKAKGFENELPLTIYSGKSIIFKATPGDKPSKNLITPEQTALLTQAILNPQGSKGSVRIYVGNEKVFHVKNGEILIDQLGLAQVRLATQETSQPTEVQTTKQSQAESQSSAPLQAATHPDNLTLSQQIENLEKLVKQQRQQLDLLNQKLDQLLSSSPTIADNQLGNWFKGVYSNISATGQNLVAQISHKIQQNQILLKTYVNQLVTEATERVSSTAQSAHSQIESTASATRNAVSVAKDRVLDTTQAFSNTVQAVAGEFALGAMTAATEKIASVVGEKRPDGSVIIETQTQRLEINGGKISTAHRTQTDPQALWEKYSQGVEAFVPALLTQAVARNALRDGQTKLSVSEILTADPEFKRIESKLGLGKASQYADLALGKASRLERLAQGKQQQQPERQQQKEQNEPGF